MPRSNKPSKVKCFFKKGGGKKKATLHFNIPDREVRCSSCGNEPSREEECIMGIVDTLFCKIFKATSFKESYGPACIYYKSC